MNNLNLNSLVRNSARALAVSLTLAFLTPAGSAQDEEVPVPELETLKKEYASLVTAADEPYQTAVVGLKKKYFTRLEREQATAQQAGKLDEAMAIEGVKEAILADMGVPVVDDAKIPLALRNMHATYRAEIAKLEPARDLMRAKNLKPLRDDYLVELDALVLRLTKDGKLKEARTVKKFRESFLAVSAVSAVTAGASQNLSAGQVMSVKLRSGVVMKFCYCPPGSFKMGSPPDEKDRGGREDQVRVRLSKGFWLAQTECTQAQWVTVMGNNPSKFKGDDLPVEQVSWNDAQKFITKLNEVKTLPAGLKAALPTEAQWEHACRAGTKTAFSFGETLNAKQANFRNPLKKTKDVASYAANPWGLYDMHGNVWEWCEDWYGDTLPGGTDPKGVTSGSVRVFRGGEWGDNAGNCRAAVRRGYLPDFTYSTVGFRVALSSVP
jgi:formylglycine-generating enzyme required for sulfatase activity